MSATAIVTELAWHAVVAWSRCCLRTNLLWLRLASEERTECPKVLTLEFYKFDKEYLPVLENSTVEVL